MRKAKFGPVLNQRDLQVMKFLFEHRVATREQIGIAFFCGRVQSTVQERLDALVRAKYLTKTGAHYGGISKSAYGLDEKGLKEVIKCYSRSITNPICKSDSVVHDLGLVDIRKRLQKTKMLAGYIPENVLQACGEFQEQEAFKPFCRLNSDAAIILNTKGGPLNIALEYEASHKTVPRYAKKLRDYYQSREVRAVFYICAHAGIERTIRQAELEVAAKHQPKLFICDFEKFQAEDQTLVFTDRSIGKILVS